MIEIFPLLLKVTLAVFFYMSLLYSISLITKRADIVDIGWGLGFILISLVSLLSRELITDSMIIVFILVLIWGIRLAFHIYTRNRKNDEDYRYVKFRKDWGRYFVVRSYFQIFLLQGIFMIIVSLPMFFIYSFTTSLNYLTIIGVIVWILGFATESTADSQLKNFIEKKKKRKSKTRFADNGLWKYSRHPNYLGEILQWWGIGVFALNIPFGYFGLIGPVFITYLIVFVSGVPLLEKKFEKDPEWKSYLKRTNKLLPFPKHI